MQQPEQAETGFPSKQIRYRKFNITGSTALVLTTRNEKLASREFELQGPRERAEMAINIKLIEPDYYQKYKIDNGIKSLLRAYDQNRKRASAEGMSRLGLDIIKIKSFSNTVTQKLGRSSDSAPKIVKQDSTKWMEQRQILSPIKVKPTHAGLNNNDEKNWEDEGETETNPLSMTTRSGKGKQKQKKRIFRRTEEYLYKKLEGTERNVKQEQNVVYDKRIKSYLQFLWKNMISHNIYFNLDLKYDDINNRPKKWKAYIAAGNNGAMIKGLLKRRFWWNIAEERTSDCHFVWTQLKVADVFERQKRTMNAKPSLKNQQDEQGADKASKSYNRFRLSKLKCSQEEEFAYKLLSKGDQKWQKVYRKFQDDKERDYSFRVQRFNKELKIMLPEDQNYSIHNHLIHNFYLGNKKALFYNLREYYSLIGQNVFNYLPLTFHIRKGLKDPEYARFVEYYKRRQSIIDKEQKQEEYEGAVLKHKMRNIWIVKPGENSNQGRGITVIDEIYQLNSLMKQGQPRNDSPSLCKQETERTYIVQMYIDRPLLYNNRKFDIRHYLMISNFFGVTRAYWYEQGYIRTSSYQFDISNFEPQIHLTNDAVQKRYPDYHKFEPYNKISYEEFQRYLDGNHGGKKYNFKEQILPQMKRMGTDAVRSVFTKISPGNLMGNFEIFGLDFMIDSQFKPWLIEINTNPCLECACPLLNRIIPYMAEQSFKLTIDLAFPPPTHYPNTSKHLAPLISLETFKYQLIFDSQVSGEDLLRLYRKSKNNLIEQIGEIEDDEQFKDQGRECKLDDFT